MPNPRWSSIPLSMRILLWYPVGTQATEGSTRHGGEFFVPEPKLRLGAHYLRMVALYLDKMLRILNTAPSDPQ